VHRIVILPIQGQAFLFVKVRSLPCIGQRTPFPSVTLFILVHRESSQFCVSSSERFVSASFMGKIQPNEVAHIIK
jgi:hypothetical protein